LAAAGCASPLRLSLASSSPPAPAPAGTRLGLDEYRDGAVALRFDASTEGIRVTVRNLSASGPLVVEWARALYLDPQGGRHAVVAYQSNTAAVLRQDPVEPLVLGPGEAWSGRVHPRDRIPAPSGPRFFEEPLLAREEAAPGTVVRLVLPVQAGGRTAAHEFRFRLTPPEVRP
ncbi:MAG TPA: hypothetical protein VHF22_10510, partial [Planctomycetota bacterium]|nr:hypothetical protein [Planctomycetota bacterium]